MDQKRFERLKKEFLRLMARETKTRQGCDERQLLEMSVGLDMAFLRTTVEDADQNLSPSEYGDYVVSKGK